MYSDIRLGGVAVKFERKPIEVVISTMQAIVVVQYL